MSNTTRPKVKQLSVDRGILAKNKANGTNEAPLCITCGNDKYYGRTVRISGPSSLIYRPDSPFDGFTSAWIETEAPLVIFDAQAGIDGIGQVVLD